MKSTHHHTLGMLWGACDAGAQRGEPDPGYFCLWIGAIEKLEGNCLRFYLCVSQPAGVHPRSVADCYYRAMALCGAERLARGVVWTNEPKSRDDWPRAWKWLGPEFGDCDPATIQPEHFLRLEEPPAS